MAKEIKISTMLWALWLRRAFMYFWNFFLHYVRSECAFDVYVICTLVLLFIISFTYLIH